MDTFRRLGGWRPLAVLAIALAVGLVFAVSATWASGPRGERAGDDGEADQTEVARQATVTPDQARTAALAAVPGTVQALRLQREEGAVTYRVTVQPQGGGTPTAVHVDATTGKVLKMEPANREEDDGGD